MCVSVGVRLCADVIEECVQHPGGVFAVPLHLLCHCSPTVQGQVLLLHRPVEENRTAVQVSRQSSSVTLNEIVPFVSYRHSKSTKKEVFF